MTNNFFQLKIYQIKSTKKHIILTLLTFARKTALNLKQILLDLKKVNTNIVCTLVCFSISGVGEAIPEENVIMFGHYQNSLTYTLPLTVFHTYKGIIF